MEINRLEGIIESILFTMGDSVELSKIALAIGHDEDTTRRIIHCMMDKINGAEERGVKIIELEDSFQMCTKAESYEYLIRIAKQPRKYTLTDVQLETLSIIAYKQPITKIEIEQIRGVKSDHAVNRLIEYNLVYEVGRLDAPGRPALFATTEEFLRRFGVGSMEELPVIDPEQLDEFKLEVEEELQMNDEELQAVLEAAASAESGTEKSPEGKAGETAKEKPGEKAEGQTGGQAKEP